MVKKITKAVIPAAGFGTRFLPQTKAMPKEMLPIVDKPVIQYVVEELVAEGIKDIIIVTGYHKRGIEDHFDKPNSELVKTLEEGGERKRPLLDELNRISEMANFVYVRQKGPYGNGTPLLNVESLIDGEPFLYTWSDDFILSDKAPRFRQLIDTYNEFGCSVLAGMRASRDEDYKRYGYAAGTEIRPGLIDATQIIEKPGKDKAPSDMATVSGFVLTAGIFENIHEALDKLQPGQELYYNDALKLMISKGERVLVKEIEGGRYCDTGNKLEYMKTVVEFAVKHPEIGEDFSKWLAELKV